jgi:dipeptidyl aminopeptidase/acylaminoacyl peptidase
MLLRMLFITGALVLLFGTESFAQDRYFTVRDSIEMARFDRTAPRIEFSPDKHYFAVVTSRGIIRSNTIESTIWVFKTDAVRAFLQTHGPASAPMPKSLAHWSATPQISSNDSYESVISDMQWSPDSSAVLFLAQNPDTSRQLDRVELSTGLVRVLSPYGYDVTKFVCTNDSIIYEAVPPNASPLPKAARINADASDISGLALSLVLFPSKIQFGNAFAYSYLWIIRNGKTIQLAGPDATRPLHLLDHDWNDVLSISPDGRHTVVVLPVDTVPKAWDSYDPEPFVDSQKIDPKDPNTTSRYNLNRLVQYALVDLQSGAAASLIDAPVGMNLGIPDYSNAAWSHDGKKILLMNTFLPLDGSNVSERLKRYHACAAAVVDVHVKEIECVSFSRTYAKAIRWTSNLVDGFFDRRNDVILHFVNGQMNQTEERYHYHNGNWESTVSSARIPGTPAAALEPFSLAVKQDLNTPPTLWATNSQTTKKLWDPNPQLTTMDLGEASVVHWKDPSGYEWTAGLVKPPGYISGRRYPLVIQTHGFRPQEFISDGSFTTAFAARPLASAGMIVLQISYDYDHTNTSEEIPDQVRGFKSAIDRLASDGLIDPKRVGIIGFSRSCYHVEGALIDDPKLFAAAAITDGVDQSYMQYLLSGIGLPNDPEYEKIYGTKPFGKGLATWVREAPDFHLDRIQTPLKIEAIGQSSVLDEWEIYASLRMQKKPVEFVYIPDGQHILQKPLDRLASQQGNVDWFRFWLQGYEDPDPAKALQYSHWRELRASESTASVTSTE